MNFDEFEAKFKNLNDKIALKGYLINELFEQDVIKLNFRYSGDSVTSIFAVKLNETRDEMLNLLKSEMGIQLNRINSLQESLNENLTKNFMSYLNEVRYKIDKTMSKFKPRKCSSFECIFRCFNLEKPLSLYKVHKYSKLLLAQKSFKISLPIGFKIVKLDTNKKFLSLPANLYFIFAKGSHNHYKMMVVNKDGDIQYYVDLNEDYKFFTFDSAPSFIIFSSMHKNCKSLKRIYDFKLNLVSEFEDRKFLVPLTHNFELIFYSNPKTTCSYCYYNADRKKLKEVIFNYEDPDGLFYIDENNEEELSKQVFDRIAFEDFSNKRVFFMDANTGERIRNMIKTESKPKSDMLDIKEDDCEITRIDYDQNLNVYYFNKAKRQIKVYNQQLELLFKVRYSKKYKTLRFTNIDSVVFNERLTKDLIMEFNEY